MHVPRNPPDLDVLFSNEEDLRHIFSADVKRYAVDFNRKYLHWSEVRFRDTGSLKSDHVWARMKFVRLDNSITLKFGEVSYCYYITEGMMKTLHEFDIKASVGLFPENVDSNRKTYYSISSLMEESISSSQMEGAVTTTKKAKEILRKNIMPKDKSERMIVNNYNAMMFIKQNCNLSLTSDLIKEVHRIVTDGTLDERCRGRYRDNDEVVVKDPLSDEIYHQPVPNSMINEAIQQLCDFINDEGEFVHPLIKGIILHYVIAHIHPFEDGNGRVARILFYWYGLKSGYRIMEYLALSRYIKGHKGKYDESYVFGETDDNDMNYFILYNLKALMDSVGVFENYLKRKIKEEREMKLRLSNHGFNERQIGIITNIVDGETITVRSIMNQYDVSLNTSRSDIRMLSDAGLLTEVGKEVNSKVYSWSGKDI